MFEIDEPANCSLEERRQMILLSGSRACRARVPYVWKSAVLEKALFSMHACCCWSKECNKKQFN